MMRAARWLGCKSITSASVDSSSSCVYRCFSMYSLPLFSASSPPPPSPPRTHGDTDRKNDTTILSSCTSSEQLGGWRSLAHYPPWTEEDAPSNHAGDRGVMSCVLRTEVGKQLLDEMKIEKREKQEKKRIQEEQQPEWEREESSGALGESFPLLGSLGVGTTPSSVWVSLPALHGPLEVRGEGGEIPDTTSCRAQPRNSPSPSSFSSTLRRRNYRASEKYSGVQREMLMLYRSFLKSIAVLHDAPTRQILCSHVREKFNEGAAIPRRKIDIIEWKLNYGKRKLEELNAIGRDSTFRIAT